MLLITFCNQEASRRAFGLAALDPATARLHWINISPQAKDMGATGFAFHEGLFFVVAQSKKEPRLVALDPASWRKVASVPFDRVGDPHSLVARPDGLYIASSGDNAVYRLVTRKGKLTAEELIWRYPATSESRDDVHVNSLAFCGDRLLVTGFGPRDEGGGWGRNDGFVIDTGTGRALARGINHPHSLVADGDRLALVESFTGRVLLGRLSGDSVALAEVATVPGYPRGLAFDGGTLLIGTSLFRQISRSTEQPMKDARRESARSGLWRVDLKTRELTHLLDTTEHGPEIFEIGVLNGGAAAGAGESAAGRRAEQRPD